MTVKIAAPALQKEWTALLLLTITTLTSLSIGIIALFSGWLTIFQNLFYIPIIVSCAYYMKKGFIFSVFLTCLYFILMMLFTQNSDVLVGAFIRVLIFILVAGVVTYLSLIRASAEVALRASEERYRIVADFTANWEYWEASDGTLLYISPACQRITGYSPQEFMDDPHLTETIIYPDDRHVFDRHRSDMKQPAGVVGVHEVDFRIFTKDGSIRWIGHTCRSVFGDEEVSLGRRASNREITDRKQVEEALRLANTKLNLLTAITRHDIQNQVTVLLGYLTLAEETGGDPGEHDMYLKKAETAGARISHLIAFTKEYQQIGVETPTWRELRSEISEAEGAAPLGNVKVENLVPRGLTLYADPLIVKVFYNLLDNAVRYGGKITQVRFSARERDGALVVVCEDDGSGVPVDEKEKIFARGYGKNTGLGLFLSREILSITGMTITEIGEPGKGARFEVTVPNGAYRFTSTKEK
jgi:PAS domain S-box-containing protein